MNYLNFSFFKFTYAKQKENSLNAFEYVSIIESHQLLGGFDKQDKRYFLHILKIKKKKKNSEHFQQ